MPQNNNQPQDQTYRVGNTTFIVTPVYKTERGESLAAILLRLMKDDVERVS